MSMLNLISSPANSLERGFFVCTLHPADVTERQSITERGDVQVIQEMQDLLAMRNVRVKEAMPILGVGLATVYELMDSGALKSVRIGRSRRIPLDALREYMASLRGESA